MFFINEKNGKKESLVVNNGFFTVFGLYILQNVLILYTLLTILFTNNLRIFKDKDDLHYAELYAIHYAKQRLLLYEEKEEIIHYENYNILFQYEDIICFITLYKDNETILKSRLEWDDIDNQIISYTYL